MLELQGWERVMNTLSVRRPQPHNTNPYNERIEREISRERAARPIKRHCPCSLKSHIIEYWVIKIVPQKYLQGNKSPVVLRGAAARRRISIPLCDHRTACNTHAPSEQRSFKPYRRGVFWRHSQVMSLDAQLLFCSHVKCGSCAWACIKTLQSLL